MLFSRFFIRSICLLLLASCQSNAPAPITSATSATHVPRPVVIQSSAPTITPVAPSTPVTMPAPSVTQSPQNAYISEVRRWRAERAQALTKDDGWLTVAGLYWLKPGANKAGSGPNNAVIFPRDKAPESTGTFILQNGQVSFTPATNAGVSMAGRPVAQTIALKNDEQEAKPTPLELGSLRFYLIKRGELLGVRIKDLASAARTSFKGLNYFDANPSWRIETKLIPHPAPKKIPIANVIGLVSQQDSPGMFVFTVNGKTYTLDALGDRNDPTLDIMYADDTNGRETYGAGRYMDAVKISGDTYVIDFNKSYSPPCAFTRFATCPLPPAQNRLKVSVNAGEKTYTGPH
jgi:uncharacterized protein